MSPGRLATKTWAAGSQRRIKSATEVATWASMAAWLIKIRCVISAVMLVPTITLGQKSKQFIRRLAKSASSLGTLCSAIVASSLWLTEAKHLGLKLVEKVVHQLHHVLRRYGLAWVMRG